MTGIDYVGYALGQTDKFQGTGVYSGIKLIREPAAPPATVQPDGDADAKPPTAAARTNAKEKEIPSTVKK
jgi:hypothetical protein